MDSPRGLHVARGPRVGDPYVDIYFFLYFFHDYRQS